MAKIHGIRITKDTMVSGELVSKGDDLFVPDDITEEDAKTLLKMGTRAEEIVPEGDEQEEETEADGANVPDPDPAINSTQLLALLDKKASDIDKAVRERKDGKPVISDDALARLYKAEQDGNTRGNVVKVLESEMKTRGLS